MGGRIFKVVWLLSLIACAAAIVFSVNWVLHLRPWPKSDVPVTTNTSWWASQEKVRVESLDIEVVDGRLGLLKKEALVRFRIKGTLAGGHNGWRPTITEAQISQRVVMQGEPKMPVGDILIAPAGRGRKDVNYKGESLPFDIKLESYVDTYQWLTNRYVVRCGAIQKELVLFQKK